MVDNPIVSLQVMEGCVATRWLHKRELSAKRTACCWTSPLRPAVRCWQLPSSLRAGWASAASPTTGSQRSSWCAVRCPFLTFARVCTCRPSPEGLRVVLRILDDLRTQSPSSSSVSLVLDTDPGFLHVVASRNKQQAQDSVLDYMLKDTSPAVCPPKSL
jgi:hypothetical protein